MAGGPWGLTSTGFVRKPLEVILADIEARQKATIAEDLDVSTESIIGQLNGIYARETSLVWEALEAIVDAQDPDKAEDASLVALAKLTGTAKRDASYSRVTMSLNLDTGTLLESGVHFVASDVDPDVRFTPEEDYTAPTSGGGQLVVFRAETKGPVLAGNGELTVIATPVTGWNSATNGADATPGLPVDTNEVLRERREAQIASAGSSTLRATRAAVSAVADVIDVLGFENVSSVTDPNGLPPHSLEIVLWDDGLADDDAIAAAIYDNRAGGVRAFGSESGTVEDDNGDDITVAFSRFTALDVYVEYDLEVDDDFVLADFQLAVATAADAAFTGGTEIRVSKLIAIAEAQDHVTDVVGWRLGYAASPTGTVNLPVTIRQIGRFDSTRVDVTEV